MADNKTVHPHKAGRYFFQGSIKAPYGHKDIEVKKPAPFALELKASGAGIPVLDLERLDGQWFTDSGEDIDIPTKLSIGMYFHCGKCLKELPAGMTPQEFARYEVGATNIGIQVWCKRHQCNVVHMHFGGHQHIAALQAGVEMKPATATSLTAELEGILEALDGDLEMLPFLRIRLRDMIKNRREADGQPPGTIRRIDG